MDERMAAMVLTSLSCSPISPPFTSRLSDTGSVGSSDTAYSSSYTSSPSPPLLLSRSAPLQGTTPQHGNADEGIDVDDAFGYFADEASPRKRKASTKVMYRCAWHGCGMLLHTDRSIASHVREVHLGRKKHGGGDSDMSDDNDDHEEEFYYTEEEVGVDIPLRHGQSLSPTPITGEAAGAPLEQDPIFKEHQYGARPCHAAPIPIPLVQKSLSWQPSSTNYLGSPHSRRQLFNYGSNSVRSSPMHSSSSSLKCVPLSKKSRGEMRKCRKVYGMENRDQWCTQCKWKKACTRFLE
ncbi:PREDICTED: zinc finger protein 704-like [Priapulus caudatus]|uniref:Zinc finger protein 704-like n=1 Tax=Priapulus caudatus TaxID=37621 RepID=A0ABM1E9C0_PRICU|nr:PREDICTED: zinc finger protein 704-like [Priapulus caudatus]